MFSWCKVEEGLDCEELILWKGIQKLPNDIYQKLFQLILKGFNLSFALSNDLLYVDILHQGIVNLTLVNHLLKNQQVLKLEEYPSRFNLVSNAF